MLAIIFKREFTNVLGARSTKITTTIMVIIFLLAGLVGGYFLDKAQDSSTEEASKPTFALTAQTEALRPYLTALGAEVKNEMVRDPEATVKEHEEWVVLAGDPDVPTILANKDAEAHEDIAILAATQRLIDETGALTPELSQRLEALHHAKVMRVSTSTVKETLGFIMANTSNALIVFTIMMGITLLMQGVVEEKSSRVVEILLATVKPRTLLTGKILGIGSAALVIFLLYIAGILGGLYLAGLLDNLALLGKLGLWAFLPTMLMWVVLGYFTTAAIAGGIASTVSRQEDLGSAQAPLIFLQMIPMYLGLFLVPNLPDAPVTKILSFIPFFSPYVMTTRTAFGGVPLWEQGVSVAITVVAIVGLAALAGKIYERSILHTGERLKLRTALTKAA